MQNSLTVQSGENGFFRLGEFSQRTIFESALSEPIGHPKLAGLKIGNNHLPCLSTLAATILAFERSYRYYLLYANPQPSKEVLISSHKIVQIDSGLQQLRTWHEKQKRPNGRCPGCSGYKTRCCE